MSAPRENVLLVPDRNVLLTGSGWEGARTRSSDHDPAGQRPPGSSEESPQETDNAKASRRGARAYRTARAATAGPAKGGGRPGRDTWPAGAKLESQAERRCALQSDHGVVAGSLPWLRSDPGQRISGQETQADDRARDAPAADDPGRTVARAAAEDRSHPRMASAAQIAGRAGAVGYLRARLVGRARREAVSDLDDRRRHQRADGALCRARLHCGKHAAAVELSGTPWTPAGVLHRQGQFVSNCSQDRARPEGIAARRTSAAAAHSDRPRAARVGHHLDRGTFAASQGTRRAQLSDRARPAGERLARGRGADPRSCQPESGAGVWALGESTLGGRASC